MADTNMISTALVSKDREAYIQVNTPFFEICTHTDCNYSNKHTLQVKQTNKSSVGAGIVVHPLAPGYHCPPPLNSKNILNFENLFAPSHSVSEWPKNGKKHFQKFHSIGLQM